MCKLLHDQRLWPLWVGLFALLLLLPNLGSYGFWEPQEMAIATRTLPPTPEEAAAAAKVQETRRAKAVADKAAGRTVVSPPPKIARSTEDVLVTIGMDTFGKNEFATRLPFALLGLLAALVTYFIGLRVRGPRAGLLAALVLLTCPLFVFQARQLNSGMIPLFGSTVMVLGAVGLLRQPNVDNRWLAGGIDCLLVAIGAYIASDSGIFTAVLPALAAIPLAIGANLTGHRPASPNTNWRYSLVIAVCFLCLLAGLVFLPDALFPQAWKDGGNLKQNFNSMFQQVVFGTFPWICLAPIAAVRLGIAKSPGTQQIAAQSIFAWMALTWVACTIAQRNVGPVQFAALPGIAVAVGIWLDEIWDARKGQTVAGDVGKLAPPLVALFVLLAAVVVSKDIKSFPEIFAGIHLHGGMSKFPEELDIHKILTIAGLLFGVMLSAALLWWHPKPGDRPQRNTLVSIVAKGFVGAFVLAGGLALFLAQVWTPKLATKLSSKATFHAYRSLSDAQSPLGIVGKSSPGHKFYAPEAEPLRGRSDLMTFLQRPLRVFALIKKTEICPLHRDANRKHIHFYLVDDSNAEQVMISNRMWNGPTPPPPALHSLMRGVLDKNPLSRSILRTEPKDIQHPLNINFDDKLHLIGVDMPKSVSRGSTFSMTLYYKVVKPISKNWQIFAHFDGGGVRFQGDHYPIDKQCGTNYWQPGDYIVDSFPVKAGAITFPKTDYKVWTGLFVGSGGNWENMKAVTGHPDKKNRVPIGTITVK